MAYKILIDAGHGGSDPGAVYNGRQEKDDVLRLALAVGRILSEQGIDVVYSRTDDTYDSPYEKAVKGNQAEADLFLSIHRNAVPIPGTAQGIETLVYSDTGLPAELARNINSQLEAVGFANRGVIERPNLVVLRRTKMPAALVEVGFIDSDNDNQIFDQNFETIAQAIANGVLETVDNSGNETEDTWQDPILPTPSLPSSSTDPTNPPNQPNRPNRPATPDRPGQSNRPEQPGRPTNPNQPGSSNRPNQGSPSNPTNPGNSSNPSTRLYRVQVGAYRNSLYASQLLRQLLAEGFPAFIVYNNGLYRVQVGAFRNLDNAVRMERRLQQAGYNTFITG